MMTKTEKRLAETLTAEIKMGLINALRRAYESNILHFDPSIGHDAPTFGFMLYKSKVHFISELATQNPSIQIRNRFPYFSFQIGEYLFSTYRVGDSLDLDISNCFPKNRTRAWRLAIENRNQLQFPFMEEQAGPPDDSNCREVILADIGNEIEGLVRVFVGIPWEISSRMLITKWSTQLDIWSGDINSISTPPSFFDRAPVERVTPMRLTLKQIPIVSEKK
jgi:hypothetical protein